MSLGPTYSLDVAAIYSAQDIESLPILDHNFANIQHARG
jgi:hypothetical protein